MTAMGTFTGQEYVILRAPSRRVMRDASAGPVATPMELATDLEVDEVDKVNTDILQLLAKDRTVLAYAPAFPMKLIEPTKRSAVSGEALRAATWGIAAVGATSSPFTGEGVTVAVLDTGIDATHLAFKGVDLVTRDFTGTSNTNDTDGHGTHCAGTLFGREVNGVRIGVAPGVRRALIGKVIGPYGGSTVAICKAINWAAENGASVISLSLGFDYPALVQSLVENTGRPIAAATSMALDAYRENVMLFETLSRYLEAGGQSLLIAASGNESGRNETPPYEINVAPPAAAASIISVGALARGNQGLEIAFFSNTGATVAAPGVRVASAAPGGGTELMDGTSMATPHVAGVAALWAQKLDKQGQLTREFLHAKVVGSANMKGLAPGARPVDVGLGLVRAPQE